MRALLLVLAGATASVPEAPEVLVGRDAAGVQEAIDLAPDGAVVVLPPGTWPGPVNLDRALTLTSRGGVLDGGDRGTILRLTAPGARVEGLRLRGSGVDRPLGK